MEMVLDGAAGDSRDGAVCLYWRGSGDALVELAASAAVRLAHAWLLASVGVAGAVPDSVRRTAPWGVGPTWWAPMARAVPEHEPGRAGEISAGHGGGLQRRFTRSGVVDWGKESLCVSHYFVIVPITLPGKVAIRILVGRSRPGDLGRAIWENRWLEWGRRGASLPNELKTSQWDFVSERKPDCVSRSSIPRSNCFASAALRTRGSMTSYKFSRLASQRSSGIFPARTRFCGRSENEALPASGTGCARSYRTMRAPRSACAGCMSAWPKKWRRTAACGRPLCFRARWTRCVALICADTRKPRLACCERFSRRDNKGARLHATFRLSIWRNSWKASTTRSYGSGRLI